MPQELDDLVPPFQDGRISNSRSSIRARATTLSDDLRACRCSPCVMMLYLTMLNLIIAGLGLVFYATASVYLAIYFQH